MSFRARAPELPEISARFGDYHPPLDAVGAMAEANRCLFCFDAPCTQACPTHIDVPRFIKKIATENLEGSARTILEANVLGASCARACPVEVLCEGACVFHRYNKQPIQIGRLQRYAMDWLAASGLGLPFAAGAATGKRVALVGAGPASLACAAELRRRGVEAVVFDARELPGGLNTFGIAEYKLPLRESLREIDLLAELGVEFRFGVTVEGTMLETLEEEFDAVFLGIGLGAIHKLGIDGEDSAGVTNALDWIAGYKSGAIVGAPARVAVIGAGNTAIDAAIAAVRLGAREVTMVYRRGAERMSAFGFEYEHAKAEGVRFLWHVQPVRVEGDAVVLQEADGGERVLRVDCVVLAIGQGTHTEFLEGMGVRMEWGRVVVDRVTGETSVRGVFAGGDCVNGGREVVDAVAEGKRAGVAMAAWLEGAHG